MKKIFKISDYYYFQLNITREDTYFEALRKVAAWDAERHFLRLKKPFDKYEFVQSASTVNAFFTFKMNSLSKLLSFLSFIFKEISIEKSVI